MDISSLEGILVSRQSLAGNNDSRMRSLAAAECFSWCLMCTTTRQNHSAQGISQQPSTAQWHMVKTLQRSPANVRSVEREARGSGMTRVHAYRET